MKIQTKHCSICGKNGHNKQFHFQSIEKVCIDCKNLLKVEDFYVKDGINGYVHYSSRCKKCDSENYRKRTSRSPESRANILWNTAKGRCKKENILFSITANDVIEQYHNQNGRCYYTGEQMSYITGDKNIMSIDRIISSEGYTKKNIVLCCWQINRMKNDCTESDFLLLCKKICDFSNNRKF